MTPFQQNLVDVARGERDRFSGVHETHPDLHRRIDQYWRAAGAAPPADPTAEPWSAVFISWCVKTAGATAAEFKFATAHSQFVHAAIANADNNRGVFRGRRITEYAPKPGDIIQNNRAGNFSFDHARNHASYKSHSAIVVEVRPIEGVPHAITVGGNEDDTVGEKQVRLEPSGLIRQNGNRFICVIENLKVDTSPAPIAVAAGGARAHQVIARNGLNLREGPGTEFATSRLVPFGTVVHVLRTDGPWSQVDLERDGRADGHMHSSFLRPA
jgi:hypothetical protein